MVYVSNVSSTISLYGIIKYILFYRILIAAMVVVVVVIVVVAVKVVAAATAVIAAAAVCKVKAPPFSPIFSLLFPCLTPKHTRE